MNFESFDLSLKAEIVPEDILESEGTRLLEVLKQNFTKRGLKMAHVFALCTLMACTDSEAVNDNEREPVPEGSKVTQTQSEREADVRHLRQKLIYAQIIESMGRRAATSDLAEHMGIKFSASNFKTKSKDGKIYEINGHKVPEDMFDEYYETLETQKTEVSELMTILEADEKPRK